MRGRGRGLEGGWLHAKMEVGGPRFPTVSHGIPYFLFPPPHPRPDTGMEWMVNVSRVAALEHTAHHEPSPLPHPRSPPRRNFSQPSSLVGHRAR